MLSSKSFEVRFHPESHPPVFLTEGAVLSEHLTVGNSPVLFGCRTGICGTCVIEVVSVTGGEIQPKTQEETELLPMIAPGNAKARLACQIRLSANLCIHKIKGA